MWKLAAVILGWRASYHIITGSMIAFHNGRDICYHNDDGNVWRLAVMDSLRYILKTGEYRQ